MPWSNNEENIDDGITVSNTKSNVKPNNAPPCSSVFSQDNFKESITPLSSSIIKAGNSASLAPRYIPGRINSKRPKNTAKMLKKYAPNNGKNFCTPASKRSSALILKQSFWN